MRAMRLSRPVALSDRNTLSKWPELTHLEVTPIAGGLECIYCPVMLSGLKRW
jgi:hypothetical protein